MFVIVCDYLRFYKKYSIFSSFFYTCMQNIDLHPPKTVCGHIILCCNQPVKGVTFKESAAPSIGAYRLLIEPIAG